MALGVVGAAIVGGGGWMAMAGPDSSGDFLAVLSSLPSTAFLLLSALGARHLPRLVYLALTWSWAAAILAMAAWASGAPWPVDTQVLLAVAAMGIIAQLLGHGLSTWSLRWLTPCLVAVSCLLEPVLGSLWAGLYLGERVGTATLVGGSLVLVAIWIGARETAVEAPVPLAATVHGLSAAREV